MPYISFEQIWEDEIYCISISASNGTFSSSQEIYISAEEIMLLGQRLRKYPESKDHTITLERDSDCYYFLFSVFMYDRAGHTLIEIKTDNHCEGREHTSSHFFIPCEVSYLNRLGRLLCHWAENPNKPLKHEW